MRKYYFFVLFFLFELLLEPSCFALQTVSIADNQTRNITVSAHELSRIFVEGDRIQNVRGLEGAYILTKDIVQGQIYIKPTSPYQAKAFNLFITTEQGRNYNLVVTASAVSGQDIELKPSTPGKEVELWEKNTEYSQVLVKLITGMINDEVPSGYLVVYPDRKAKRAKEVKKAIKHNKLTISLQKRYLGKYLSGEVFLVQNKSNDSVNLNEAMFSQTGARAIAFLPSVLPAKGQTMLFRVTSNEQ